MATSTKQKSTTSNETFSDFERKAIKERALELKRGKADGESAIFDKIAEMPEPDQSIAKKIHAIVRENAPDLTCRTWYGMPAYSNKDGKVVCFFQSGAKYESRFSTLGFTDKANLDDGNMWPASFALNKLTEAEEQKIIELVKKAVS